MLVARLTDKGSLDKGFGSAGVVSTFPSGRAFGVGLGPGDTVVAAGDVRSGADGFRRIAVIRLDSKGNSTRALAPAGSRHRPRRGLEREGCRGAAGFENPLSASVGPAAKQVVNGFAARLTSKGALDTSFGGASTLAGTNTPGVYWDFHPVARQRLAQRRHLDPAGGIALAGLDTQDVQRQALFVRLTCAGKPQSGFGTGGVVTRPSANLNSIGDPVGAEGVGIGGGDRVIGAGRFQDSGLAEIAVWGLQTNGAEAFATRGPFTGDGAEGRGLAIDSSGASSSRATTSASRAPPSTASSPATRVSAPLRSRARRCAAVPPATLNPKNPKVSAAGRSSRSQGGKGKLKLVNKNPFTVQAKGSIVSQKAVAKKKKVKFASFSASLPAKGKKSVKVKLSKSNQKLLKKLGPTPCKLTLKLTGAGGKATATQKITLVPKG